MERGCCEHLRELLEVELEVITKHISNHKWFNHINDESEGTIDFVQKYGWIMREMYCNYVCPDREDCAIKDVSNIIREEKHG